MRSVLLLIAIVVGNIANAQMPNWNWATRSISCGGPSSYEFANSVATDQWGNMYVTGFYQSDTIHFGSHTFTKLGAADVYLVKYDAAGNVVWARNGAGATGADYAYSAATDAQGNVYVTGSFISPTITFGGITLTQTGADDMFLVKYDSAGNVLWARNSVSATPQTVRGYSVAVDAAGNAYVTGEFLSATVSFNGVTLTRGAMGSAYLVKYDANGNVLWAKGSSVPSTTVQGSTEARKVALDNMGNAFITGFSASSSFYFDTVLLGNNSPGHGCAFIAKYDNAGNVLWAKKSNNQANGSAYTFTGATDASGNCYVGGYFIGGSSLDFGSTTLTNIYNGTTSASNMAVYLVKYSAAGTVLWAKAFSYIGSCRVNNLVTDAADNVYLAGGYSFGVGQQVSQNPFVIGTKTLPYTAGSSYPFFLAKFSPGGTVMSAFSLPSGATSYFCGLAFDNVGQMCLASVYQTNPFVIGNTTLPRTGYADVFVTKFTMVDDTTGDDTTTHPPLPSPNTSVGSNNASVFPNPLTTSIATVQTEQSLTNATISIYNQQGSIVREIKNFSGKEISIPRNDLPAGLYFIYVRQRNELLLTRKWLLAD